MRMKQRGVSIVEALVALVVLSIGMLGIAGLFVESLRSSRTALLRTQAVNLASDIADRIRANASAREAYDTATYGGAPALQNCAPTASEAGSNCTIAELAEDDLASWQEAVAFALPALPIPANAAVVEFEDGAAADRPDRYLITVAWQEPGARGVEEYRYTSELVMMARPPL